MAFTHPPGVLRVEWAGEPDTARSPRTAPPGSPNQPLPPTEIFMNRTPGYGPAVRPLRRGTRSHRCKSQRAAAMLEAGWDAADTLRQVAADLQARFPGWVVLYGAGTGHLTAMPVGGYTGKTIRVDVVARVGDGGQIDQAPIAELVDSIETADRGLLRPVTSTAIGYRELW